MRRLQTSLFAFLICSVFPTVVLSQGYADIEKAFAQRKYDEAEAILKAKLQANPQDDSAHYFLGRIPVQTRNVERYDEAIDHFKKCVELRPLSSNYHLWLGRAYGVKAQNAGVFSALGYVGDIKSSFIRAVELDPNNFDARSDLIQFYLQAPGIVGGSDSKAEEVANDYARLNPEAAKLLWMTIYINNEEYDRAEAQILSIKKPLDNELLDLYRSSLSNAGFLCLGDKQPERAQRIFQRYVEQFPAMPVGYHGLGRSYFDQGKFDESIPFFEKAIGLDSTIGSQYRLGIIHQKKGDKEKAIKYLEEFVRLSPGANTKARDDAKERLEELKGN